MQQRERIAMYLHFMVWVVSALFVLSETYIADYLYCSGLVLIVIFGGALWVMIKRKGDRYNLFCWYHIAMTVMCLTIGVLDIVYFYSNINDVIINSLMATLKIVLIIAATQKLIGWVIKTIKEIKSDRSQRS